MFNNELLTIGIFFISLYEIKTGEWSLKKAGNTYVFKINFYESKKKVNLFVLEFLILQVSHKLKVPIISISFATDFCLKDGLPPQHSKYVLKMH